MKTNEAEVLIIGKVTSEVRKAIIEQMRILRSKGVSKIYIHVFEQKASLSYLEELREPLLNNIVISIRLYQHDVNEVANMLKHQSREAPKIIIADRRSLSDNTLSLLNEAKGSKILCG